MAASKCFQWSPSRTLNDVVLLPRTTNWFGTTSSQLTRTRPHYSSICRAFDEKFFRKIPSDSESDWIDFPISLRMLKPKQNQFDFSLGEAGESAIKKAFSSMVFIIRELHKYSLHMREQLFFEDLQSILIRVQFEMHSSFIWLFQQVFSNTPTLLLYVMILLANFTVHSMSNSAAFAAAVTPTVSTTVVETVGVVNTDLNKSYYIGTTTSGSNTTSVGGNNGGGNKYKPVASGMDGGDGSMENSLTNINRPILESVSQQIRTRVEEVSVSVSGQDEVSAWNNILDEVCRMQGEIRDESLENDVIKRFVSPVSAKIEADWDVEAYFRTELVYQSELGQEPNNVLILANYAQFLYLVLHDYDRAEEYFKRAIGVEPKDAEAHNKYANFLWQVRNDLWAAEETYLEAISADPTNSFYAANYAHFLWNTGGEDTCFPLDSPQDESCDS